MTFSREEQETVLVFNNAEGKWDAYSCVPKHIRKLMDIGENIKIIEQEDDRPTAIRCTLTEKQVSMKKERTLSEEAKEKLSERMKKLHKK
ncbi:hypothetical protein AB1283_00665 [Bacillus sp. S13(2024)]|uniref:hypothetical protein n=1 Tax=Bacillus sp. S13(2024) TaxID=3162885 RepID=UPI003D25E747